MTRPPLLSRGAVDRASEHRRDPAWLAQAWSSRGQVLVLDEEMRAPVDRSADVAQLRLAPAAGPLPPDALFLGADADAVYFALDQQAAPDPEPAPPGSDWAGLRDVGALLGDRDAGLLVHAVGLQTWHRSHPRCPRCGNPTEMHEGGHVRRCPSDGSEHHPRTDPAMIVLVTTPDAQKAVLGRAVGWRGRMMSCLAGFVEPGESAEQCVVREVQEEVGLAVSEVVYSTSQPWPFPCSLMLAFRAVADEAELHPDPTEISEARWVTRRELMQGVKDGGLMVPPVVSVARRLIDDWLAD